MRIERMQLLLAQFPVGRHLDFEAREAKAARQVQVEHRIVNDQQNSAAQRIRKGFKGDHSLGRSIELLSFSHSRHAIPPRIFGGEPRHRQ